MQKNKKNIVRRIHKLKKSQTGSCHIENPFKYVPFDKLALKHKELLKYLRYKEGRPILNLDDRACLVEFNKAVLMQYVGICWELPDGYLVPTITSRANYILEARDYFKYLFPDLQISEVFDLGVGANCIHLLLARYLIKQPLLKLYGSDIDKIAISHAQYLLEKNNMDCRVVLSQGQFLDGVVDTKLMKIDIVFCNPPFFCSQNEKEELQKDGFEARANEITTSGGELQFVKSVIKDSLILRTTIKLYTCFIGRKSTLTSLISYLDEIKNTEPIKFKSITLKQGETARWALFWHY